MSWENWKVYYVLLEGCTIVLCAASKRHALRKFRKGHGSLQVRGVCLAE